MQQKSLCKTQGFFDRACFDQFIGASPQGVVFSLYLFTLRNILVWKALRVPKMPKADETNKTNAFYPFKKPKNVAFINPQF